MKSVTTKLIRDKALRSVRKPMPPATRKHKDRRKRQRETHEDIVNDAYRDHEAWLG